MGKTNDFDHNTYRFGRLVHALRRARGMTQETLAERSRLSPDTIRRAEHGSFSPSLKTIGKIARGLDLDLSTLFSAFDLAELDVERELVAMARRRLTAPERELAPRLLAYLTELFAAIASSEGEDE